MKNTYFPVFMPTQKQTKFIELGSAYTKFGSWKTNLDVENSTLTNRKYYFIQQTSVSHFRCQVFVKALQNRLSSQMMK